MNGQVYLLFVLFEVYNHPQGGERKEEAMRYFIQFAVVCLLVLGFGRVNAEEPKVRLSDSAIADIVGKNIPDEISVKLTEESEEAVAMKTCQKTLQGLKVPKNCCADPKCIRAAIKQRDNEAYERRRAEVNRRFCTEYGGGSAICSDPKSAREFVLKFRADKQREEEQAKLAKEIAAAKQSQPTVAPAPTPVSSTTPSFAEQASTPVPVEVSTPSTLHHRLDLGITLVGHLQGAYGGGVYAAYRPPIVGERLELEVTFGGLVVVKNRLSLENFDPVFRGYIDANLSFRVLNWEKFSLALGCEYSRLGRFGFDKLTAAMWGPTATINIGSLHIQGAYLYNVGPKDGYLEPKWGVLLKAGFRFADFAF